MGILCVGACGLENPSAWVECQPRSGIQIPSGFLAFLSVPVVLPQNMSPDLPEPVRFARLISTSSQGSISVPSFLWIPIDEY